MPCRADSVFTARPYGRPLAGRLLTLTFRHSLEFFCEVMAMAYSASQLAQLSGVSVRTLHYYEELGILHPSRCDNNYRSYGADDVDRLQQALLYRQTGMPLSRIAELLDDPSFDRAGALRDHLAALRRERDTIDALIESVKRMIASEEGEEDMSDKERFAALKQAAIEENERAYGAEARELWGDEIVDASNERALGMTEQEWHSTKDLEQAILEQLAIAAATGNVRGPEARRLAEMHRAWLCRQWPEGAYSPAAHAGLAEMYVSDERFAAYYEKAVPGGAAFLRDAIVSWVKSSE